MTILNNNLSNNSCWTICSFFAGCGGLDLGFLGGFNYKGNHFKKHKFIINEAYDLSGQAVETYRMNIGNHIKQVDLTNYNSENIQEHDVLIGGFPCQDFSSCGPKKGLDSDRGQLYKVFVKAMELHKPKVVVAENVPHLARMKNGRVIEKIKRDLESVGYTFDVWSLKAIEYGVPQRRNRLFLIGVRNDLDGFPQRPVPTHHNPLSIEWAISDLEHITDEAIPNQSQYFKASKAKNGNGQGDEVNRRDEPAYTIRANAKSRVQFHYKLNRRLTVRECARIQTFPDDFVFPYSSTSNIMLVGNAVPPVLAFNVAQSISHFLGETNNLMLGNCLKSQAK